jgi:hypothetical protein
VVAAGTSAVQHSCSLFTISNFQNKRGIIQTTMEENVRGKLEGPDATGITGKGCHSTPGCQISYMDHHTGCHQMNRVLLQGCTHSRVSDWLHGPPYRLSSIEPY